MMNFMQALIFSAPQLSDLLRNSTPRTFSVAPRRLVSGARPTLRSWRPLIAWKHRRMDSWKTLVIALMASISADALAWYVENPVERALTATTLFPTMVLGGTTAFTVYGPS